MARMFFYVAGFFLFFLAGFFGMATFVDMTRPTSGYMNVFLFMTFSLCFFLSIIGDTLLDILSEIKASRKEAGARATLPPPANSPD